ncbi:hypothetical protein [Lysinibacillus capsici]|uniref:hypothetical protein n=1 Tax=Lysinibacillus capsici TaxID=2115968 RepID=UPI0032E4BCBD
MTIVTSTLLIGCTESKNLNNQPTTDFEVELSLKEKKLRVIDKLIESKLAFKDGEYIKGEIPEAEYGFISYDDKESLISAKEKGSDINVIYSSTNSFSYIYIKENLEVELEGLLINIDAFEELEIMGAKELFEILNSRTDYKQDGTYKIGSDIPSGEYTVRKTEVGSSGNGYFELHIGPEYNSEYVDSQEFDETVITLIDGHYIMIHEAIILQ